MEAIKRNNNFSNSELAIIVGNIVSAMNRDATEFAARNVTQTNIDNFEALGNAFEIFPTDEIYQAEISIVVDEKNLSRTNCFNKVQFITGYFEQEWGLSSPYYRQLGIKNISEMRDAEFLVACRRVVQVAQSRLTTLSTLGLTQSDIDSLNTEAQTFEDKMHLVFEKTAEREIKTQERTTLANELYSELKKYCMIGKLVWENVDEAKYNDYVIHKTVNHGLPKPQGLSVELDPVASNQANLSWMSVQDATEYELHGSQVPLGQPEGGFSLINTVLITSDLVILSSGFTYYFKIRARNAEQVSSYSDVVSIGLP